jgi:AraC-like DNA-binding protein
MPRQLLPLSAKGMDSLVAQPFSGRDGIGRLLTRFLVDLITEGAHAQRPADAVRLGTTLLHLVTAMLAHQLEASTVPQVSAPLTEPAQSTLLTDIQFFILENLKDPALTPDAIAAAHHISASHLYRLFRSHGRTVAAWVRQQRLEYCRRDLADPAHDSTPIHAIATQWGFNHPADFSRAFRTAYQVTPSEYRSQTVTAGDRQR